MGNEWRSCIWGREELSTLARRHEHTMRMQAVQERQQLESPSETKA